MHLVKDNIPVLLGITVGALLYVILNFIPLIGPFLTGIAAGKFSQEDLKRGLLMGFFSGVLGSLLIFFIFSPWLYSRGFLGEFLVGGMLLVWNLVGVLLTTIGGVVGAISGGEGSSFNFHKVISKTEENDSKRKILVVCPKCKATNPKGREYCSSCGEKL